MDWQFFDLDANEAEAKHCAQQQQKDLSLMSNPFKWDLYKLSRSQQEAFYTYLSKKVYSFINIPMIFTSSVKNLLEKWHPFLVEQDQENCGDLNKCQVNKLFVNLKDSIKQNDVQNTDAIVSVQMKEIYQPLNLVKAIKALFDFQQVFQTVLDFRQFSYSTFKDTMQIFSQCYTQMITILKIFATSLQEELLFERLICILKLGFWEFNNLYKFQRVLVHDIKVKFYSSILVAFDMSIYSFWSVQNVDKLIKKTNQYLLIKLFPTLETLKAYEQLIHKSAQPTLEIIAFQNSREAANKNKIFFIQQSCYVLIAKADLLQRLPQNQQALECLLNALRKMVHIYDLWYNTDIEDEDFKNHKLYSILIKKQKFLAKIVGLLSSIHSKNHIYKIYSLVLSKRYNMIKKTCSIYRMSIDFANCNEKIKLFKEYSQFCRQWGRLEEATVAQNRFSRGRDSFNDYNKTLHIMRNKELNPRVYCENINKLGRTFFIRDEKLDFMLQKFQEHVKQIAGEQRKRDQSNE